MLDQFGRKIDYMRISVTDKCNYRCMYCMPEQGVDLKPNEQLLTFDETVRVVEAGAQIGIKRLRLTGGEPLVRKDIVQLVRKLKSVPGIEDIALSTNGSLLPQMGRDLKEAGISRVNISLDSLKPERFRELTRRGDVNDVLAAVEAAFAVGMEPVKLNAVVIRGFNDDEICDLAALSIDRPIHMRFIEVMPLSETYLWEGNGLVPVAEMRQKLMEKWDIYPYREGVKGAGPAKYWKIPGAQGTVGFISAVTECFCADCNRVRLSSDGFMNPCLGHVHATDLKSVLRGGGDLEQLKQVMADCILKKPKEHNFDDIQGDHILRVMVQIGG